MARALFTLHQDSTPGRRETNQDRSCVQATTYCGKPAAVVAVADGMGGMQSGDRAAELAIEEVRAFARDVLPSLAPGAPALRSALIALFQAANTRVWLHGCERAAAGQVGTTLVCAVALPASYLVANTGDSRCYYVNDFEARLVTEDHSQVQELVRSGAMTAQAARRSPYRSQLTSCLGKPNPIRVDVFPAEPTIGVIDEPCALLLCSGGLHAEVTEADLFAHLQGTPSLEDGCAGLLSLASRRGSTDCITVAVVEIRRLTPSV